MANTKQAWYPTVFPDRCDGCEKLEKPRCVQFCPNNVFKIENGKAIVAQPLNCVYACSACKPLCPRKAIAFPQRDAASTATALKEEDKNLLRKAVCEKCGKTFWTNRAINVCIDCEDSR